MRDGKVETRQVPSNARTVRNAFSIFAVLDSTRHLHSIRDLSLS